MFLWLYLGRVYQTMRDSPYYRRASRAQTNSLDLMKINNVISNVKQAEPSKTNKIAKVLATAPYTANTKMYSSGRD